VRLSELLFCKALVAELLCREPVRLVVYEAKRAVVVFYKTVYNALHENGVSLILISFLLVGCEKLGGQSCIEAEFSVELLRLLHRVKKLGFLKELKLVGSDKRCAFFRKKSLLSEPFSLCLNAKASEIF